MAKKPRKAARKATPDKPATPNGSRITYRDLRNTPGQVWERLSNDEPLTLVADGEAKAIVIPVRDGDVSGALEAYRRGQAMASLRQVRERARKAGTSKMTLAEINQVVREVRAERRARGDGS